jgi:hypothetical protein
LGCHQGQLSELVMAAGVDLNWVSVAVAGGAKGR